MLVWATEFPIAIGGCNDAIRIAKETLISSPHHPWTETTLGNCPVDEVIKLENCNEIVVLGNFSNPQFSISGFQHKWVENGEREWTTEIVASNQNALVRVAIRLDCNLLRPGPQLPVPKKPYVVRQILKEMGGGLDVALTVGDVAHRLEENDVPLAANIVKGQSGISLPVVYVSVGKNRQPLVNVDELAQWLGGMAHVVVEPSKYFSFALARNSGKMNAYCGAVSIYWPRGAAVQARFLPNDYPTANAMQTDIAARVRLALTYIRPASTCTMDYLHELVSRHRIETLKASGSTAVNDYIAAFDTENKAKTDRITSLEREVHRLKAELRRHDEASKQGGGIIEPGKEREFYPGEVRDAVLHTLNLGKSQLFLDGRRAHIIKDVLNENQASQVEDDMDSEIKEAFASAGDLGPDQRRILEELGFTIESAGKHWKAIYQGDDRYVFSISKTSSDHRAGKNMSSTILKKLFK